MDGKEWDMVTKGKLIGFAIGLAVFFLLLFRSEPGFIMIIDHANLLFHEAGHPLIGFWSERLATYGGTIGQLTFPLILVISFWRKDEPVSVAGAAIWFFENWLNIARYMADARALQLPLVGGDDHDWNTIFTRWDILIYDTRIAEGVKIVGWIGIGATCLWVLWRAFQDRHRVPEQQDFSPAF